MGQQFFIKFPVVPSTIINDNSSFVLIGSCFTEHIGAKLNNAGFESTINPFGILFNPLSISCSLDKIIEKKVYEANDLIKNHENRFVSLDHHGSYSGFEVNEVIEKINESILNAHKKLKEANCLIITLGSAWVYQYLETKAIVANCHKIDAKKFSKRLLSVEEISNSLLETIERIKLFNPTLKIILTVSPVKHLKDGVVENVQSKSTLVLAIKQVTEVTQHEVLYFPAFEIVTEELRDYRFYEVDHAHPNTIAIDYVWERFKATYFSRQALDKVNDAEQLYKSLSHRTLHSELSSETLGNKIKSFLEKYQPKN